MLIDQIRETLSLGRRHSSLPLLASAPPRAVQLLQQAEDIGAQMADWAAETLQNTLDRPTPLSDPLAVRSICDGHTLIGQAVHDLLGPEVRSPFAMMLYNEWMHQMVLLRDALLPFRNWQQVPLPVDQRGLRRLEPARDQFLTELLVRQIRHTTLVDYVRDVLAPGAPSVPGYGFSFPEGRALPSVLTTGTIAAPPYLFDWTHDGATSTVQTFVPAETDYYIAQRTDVATLRSPAGPADVTSPLPTLAELHVDDSSDGTSTATLRVAVDGALAEVDLGQALRGHRYAHAALHAVAPSAAAHTTGHMTAIRVDPAATLSAPGLVHAESGEYVVKDVPDGSVALAVLGRLYPDRVVVTWADGARTLPAHGADDRARFVVELTKR